MHTLLHLAAFLALASALPSLKPKPKPKPLPLIIWHGLGDRYDADGLQSTGELAEEVHPGTYVYYIRTDDDGSADRTNTFFGNVTTQLGEVCEAIHADAGLADPDDRTKVRADALGFSQGGQFLRGLIETCEGLSVRSLVTFGSQHNGIAEFQECGTFDLLCKGATGLIKGNAWTEYVQGKVVPAQYYRTINETTGLGSDGYLEYSNFLAGINNEREEKNEAYKEKIAALENFVMVVFDEDVTVVPKETGWFAEVNATSGEVTPLRERKMYKEDWLGLKRLDEKGGLVFRNTTGKHMELSDKDLIDAFTNYFGPERKAKGVFNDLCDFPGYRDFLQAMRKSSLARENGDDVQSRFWIDAGNKILAQMREDGFEQIEMEKQAAGGRILQAGEDEEDVVLAKMVESSENEDVFNERYKYFDGVPGYFDFLWAMKQSAIAGEQGDELLRQLWLDEGKEILQQMRKEGYAEIQTQEDGDQPWVLVINADGAEVPEEVVEHEDNLEAESESEPYPDVDCGHDEAQAWIDSLSYWQRWKLDWEALWLPWLTGKAERLDDAGARLKVNGDL